MPGETRAGGEAGAARSTDDTPLPDGELEERIPMPADTMEMLTGKGDTSAETPGGTAGGSRAGGSAIDTILGRLVVEQGLATLHEVEEARKSREEADDPNERSLAQVLVDRQVVTDRQLQRLRSALEAERSNQKIPGYQVLGKIGAGAMATVFKARQVSLDRLVAIKVLPRRFLTNTQFIERFYAEGRAAAQLNHPNIVQAFDVGQSGEFHYFVMEYVEGKTVHDLIAEHKRFTEAEAVDIIINVADALHHAHERGLIHRDVKPKNIIITPEGVAKLADLGLARAINDQDAAAQEKGKAYGTPYYISPEQIRGDLNVGPQCDIYSLGATLYHMLTGSVPFNGKNPTEVMQKHLREAVVPPDHVNPKLSAGISEVIEMMMAKSRRDRYKTCADLLVDLRAVRSGETPPIAHREEPASAIFQAMVREMPESQQIAEDKSLPRSAFDEPVVRFMAIALGLLGVWAVTATIVLIVKLAMS